MLSCPFVLVGAPKGCVGLTLGAGVTIAAGAARVNEVADI